MKKLIFGFEKNYGPGSNFDDVIDYVISLSLGGF